jgi:hypothetical protein
VNALPSVSLSNLGKVCTYNPAFSLSQGIPTGGTYSGTGVSGNMFDPSVSGAGTFTLTYTVVDGNGCTNSAQSTIVVDPCLGVDETDVLIQLYPNPTNGMIQVQANCAIEKVEVYDALGRLIGFATLLANNSTAEFDFTHLATGTYQVKITSSRGSAVEQVVVNH